jgi:hypothetical protein
MSRWDARRVNERDMPALRPPICDDCGHRASLHHLEGCRAILLGRGAGVSAASRTCGCRTTLREILGARYPRPPAELLERRQVV